MLGKGFGSKFVVSLFLAVLGKILVHNSLFRCSWQCLGQLGYNISCPAVLGADVLAQGSHVVHHSIRHLCARGPHVLHFTIGRFAWLVGFRQDSCMHLHEVRVTPPTYPGSSHNDSIDGSSEDDNDNDDGTHVRTFTCTL